MIDIPGYRIERELGRGGMATVYLATQLSLQRPVALKVLAPGLASDPGFTQRFLREGRIAASLRHRHILAIHDVGVHQGLAYLALEYLPGGQLSKLPMAPPEALRLIREIAGALAHAHANGVVHRDLKPANILLQDDGSHVLADFGIARMLGASRLTADGGFAGTPAYMAPEQWRD
ncbi:MAG: serine/threonine protein kinase, partial [Xanthomonadales bacterium]|nr:serine/threonine protein kinase [Xanthomonadales bacterium]